MKKIMIKAVLIAGLAAGFTACQDSEEKKLIAELDKAKPEFLQLDSTLNQFKTFVNLRKDSLLGVAANDTKRKTEIDSILNLGEKDVLRLDSVIEAHSALTREIDTLKVELEARKIIAADAESEWNKMIESHTKVAEYAKATDFGLMLIAVTEGTGK
jgi:hypothetical protein